MVVDVLSTSGRFGARLAAAAGVLIVVAAAPSRAEDVPIRAGVHEDYGRIVFGWRTAVTYQTSRSGSDLVVTFARPIEADFGVVRRILETYVRDIRTAADGRAVTFTLARDYGTRDFTLGTSVVVDLLNAGQDAAQPRRAQAAAGGAIAVRSGDHDGYSRLVFDWPDTVDYRVQRAGRSVTVTFARPGQVNLRDVQARPPRLVAGIAATSAADGLAVTFEVPDSVGLRDFRSGSKVVVDVLASATQAAAGPAKPAAPPRPEASPPAPAPEARAAPVSLAPRPREAAAPPVAAAPQPSPPRPSATAAPSAPPPEPVIEAFTLRFDWDAPVAAAVFRRGAALWVVFDRAKTFDVAQLRRDGGSAIRSIEPVAVGEGQGMALRFDTLAGVNPQVRREGSGVALDFRRQPLQPTSLVDAKAVDVETPSARVSVPVPDPGASLVLQDPDAGDNLVVVPVVQVGLGIDRDYQYPQFQILPSAQGVVVRPRIDDVQIQVSRQGVEISAAGRTLITPATAKADIGKKTGSLVPISRVFNFERWKQTKPVDFAKTLRTLRAAAAQAKIEDREAPRLELARFYVAHRLAPEAIGVLDVMAERRPDIASTPEFRALRGAARYLMGHLDEAAEAFGHPSLAENDEARYWRSLIQADSGDMVGQARAIRRGREIIDPYPRALAFPLGQVVAEAAILTGDIESAKQQLEVLTALQPNSKEAAQLGILDGQTKELSGDFEGAVVKWSEVEQGPHYPSRIRATWARVDLLSKRQLMGRPEAIADLERLRFAWRGDDFEFQLLRRLGELYIAEGAYREGLRAFRQAATYYKDHRDTPTVTEEMRTAFEKLYLGGDSGVLTPVEAIALYDEFKELTPEGVKGDQLIEKLVDRLVGIDLLDRAADLLQTQIETRLTGAEKARVGARLALLHLLNRNPTKSVETLAATNVPNIAPELAIQRRLLQARALAELGRAPDAIDLIYADQTLDAELLRAEIYWETQGWSNAALVLRRIARDTGALPGQALDEGRSRTILNLAIALTLAGNERAVDRLRRDYEPTMTPTLYGDAFRLIAASPIDGLLDPTAMPGQVGEADKFRGFLAAYRERLRAQNLSAIN